MPIASIGPMKIRKLKRKKNGSEMNVPKVCGFQIMLRPSQILPAVSVQLSPCPKKSSTIQSSVTITSSARTVFQIMRQKAVRRRETMSLSRSSMLSSPKRLGDSMKRRKPRSMRPRNAATSMIVSTSA